VILSSGYTGDVLSRAEDTPWPLLRKPYGAEQLAPRDRRGHAA
jgi:hypothetical protein